MAYVFYEQSGKPIVAQVMEQKEQHVHVKGIGSSLQKIKLKDVLLQTIALPTGVDAQSAAPSIEQTAQSADLEFIWECAPDEVFEFTFLAHEYFGEQANFIEQAAMWHALHHAPIYFGKKGKGQFIKQNREQIDIALAAVAKKEERLRQQAIWVDELIAGRCPDDVRKMRDAIVQKKNANDMSYKAVLAASEQLNLPIPALLLHAGAYSSAFDYHRASFISEHYPNGLAATLPMPTTDWHALPVNNVVTAFSIDDSFTTEIDDAFSVQVLDNGCQRIGVHIAAPSLVVVRDDAVDTHAASRMSTMYTPGEKVTMLPDDWVAQFSLDEGSTKPVVSIYVTFNATGETPEAQFSDVQTVIEQVHISDNLRHDVPELQLSVEDLTGERSDYPQSQALKVLWKAAQALSAQRDAMRGKPENNNRADFSFTLEKDVDVTPTGDEVVQIVQRQRGSPIDKIVSEWMIFANVRWAQMLDSHHVPALFRSQSPMGVRTSTHAQPHLAMGVPAYMWATSPLRRYADLLNQMQLRAVIDHGVTAPMQAPFKAKEVDLLKRMSAFDEKYRAYADQQNLMEKYWCLQWVKQRMNEHGHLEAPAIVIKENLMRLCDIPLYIPNFPTGDAAPSTQRILRLSNIDWVALSLDVQVVELS
ncbi:ribonuclease II [Formosimonas limnophila]|uniref:Ribonuclease II n=1 Tax=Formosimonas limnophila TaxID=1384487 RepID=A0A8J3CF29_9BURK|nr:RNB domain-containing ribonuclease [Formosimonas limnophila]GHA63995.1 ribonuclease II [Formosimonas limnophila]